MCCLLLLLSPPPPRCLEVQEAIWAETFKYMADNKVMLEGILLKPAMVTPGETDLGAV